MIFNKEQRKRFFSHPGQVISASFAVIIALGTLLLMLPFSSKSGEFTPFLNAFFTATSATCVTGLVTYDTFSHWSNLGQGVILALIQIGGLGLVTFTTFFNLALGRKMGLRTMRLAQESGSFDSFAEVNHLGRFVVKLSLVIELAGALLLCLTFVPRYGWGEGIFISIFLGISAFCNAGFDILGREGPYVSLTNYNGDPVVMTVIPLLIILGGIGFIVIHDLMQYRKTKTLMLHTRIVLLVTGILIAFGTLTFLVMEWGNPGTLGALPVHQRFGAALFQSVTMRTAGFNSVSIEALRAPTKFISILLMFIGAAPASTGGGIKLTTITVLVMTVVGVVKGRPDAIILRRRVPQSAVYKAMAVFCIGLLMVALCTAAIYFRMENLNPGVNGLDVLFEEVSAFATVGVSAGITAQADWMAKLLLIVSMFMGRVGPVSLALSLAMRGEGNKKEIIPDGKILVG